MCRKLNLLRLFTSPIFFVYLATVCHSAEKIDRTIEIKYPSKQISGSTAVVGVPGCKYTFKVVGTLPGGTHIEWKGQSTTKGSWSDNVLYPYAVGGGSGTYHIKAVLVGGGGGEGAGWEVDVDGTITDPVLTYSEPGEDTYFAEGQTTPTPQVDLKVTVTKPGGTKLEGVDVRFVGKREDDSILGIGISSSNSSGEATKPWTVPVGSYRRYTLKAGTGNDWLNLENEITGKKVYAMRLIAKLPVYSHFITAKSSNTDSFPAELHDPDGIVTSATESVTFELTSNPRGSIQTPVSAVAGVATATYTAEDLTWWEESKPSGNVKTDITESFRSSADTEYIYVLPTPGVDVSELGTTINGLFVSLSAVQRQQGPPLPTIGGNADDRFYVNSPSQSMHKFRVHIDWGDESDPTEFIQYGGTGIGTKSHTYDSVGNYTITMTVDGNVKRIFNKTGGGTHTEYFMNYQADEEEKEVNL